MRWPHQRRLQKHQTRLQRLAEVATTLKASCLRKVSLKRVVSANAEAQSLFISKRGHYRELELQPGASLREINVAYRRRALQCLSSSRCSSLSLVLVLDGPTGLRCPAFTSLGLSTSASSGTHPGCGLRVHLVLLLRTHPDKGGSSALFGQVQAAYMALRESLRKAALCATGQEVSYFRQVNRVPVFIRGAGMCHCSRAAALRYSWDLAGHKA